MSDERPERCDRCRFWKPPGRERETGITYGECHRFPPFLPCPEGLLPEDQSNFHPSTEPDDWCGEFRPKDGAQDADTGVLGLDLFHPDREWSVKVWNILKRMGLHTVGDLTRLCAAELLGERNFGETALAEVRLKLRELNLRLRGDPP